MTSTSKAPTIIDLKVAFLRQQIVLLSQPITPSSAFLSKNEDSEDALRQKSIDDALHKLNGLLKKHNNLVYGPQAKRHVAEQIDRVYWNGGDRGVQAGEEWSERGADLSEALEEAHPSEQHTDRWTGKKEIIEQLPDQWEGRGKDEVLEEKYRSLSGRLSSLSEKRQAAIERLRKLRELKSLVDPLGPEGELQSNLVTRNGEVEVELEKMRRLLLRVERGIGGLQDSEAEGEDMMDIDGETENRVLALLR